MADAIDPNQSDSPPLEGLRAEAWHDREFRVKADIRLDVFLGEQLNLSRAAARRALDSGRVFLNGRRAAERDKGVVLSAGALVTVVAASASESSPVTPEPGAPLAVLNVGDGWIAVDKPAGQPVHPLREGEVGTLLNAAVARFPELQGVGEGGLRSGVVHRLDVGTSGVLILATDEARWAALRSAFAEHRTEKVYRAIVLGRLAGEAREQVDLYVAQHRPARVRVVPPETPITRRPPGTRQCDLEWRAIETFTDATMLEVRLGTGFLHQIRATLASLGHPVAGDAVYRPASLADPTGAPRPMLHAASLRIGEIHAEAPEPADFVACLGRLRAGPTTSAAAS